MRFPTPRPATGPASASRPGPTPHVTRRILARSALGAALLAAAALALTGLGFAVPTASASTLTIYSNSLKGADGRAKVRQFGGKANCSRKGSTKALRVTVGKATRECFFGVPVVGRDLQASVTARLFRKTPKRIIKRTWVAVNLRQSTDGSRYQFLVIPRTRRYSLRKIDSRGRVRNLAHGKSNNVIKPPDKANKITLRAFNGVKGRPAGSARLLGMVNGKRLVLHDDAHGNELEGRDTTISIGSKKGARNAMGSFLNLKVAMPDPF